MIFKFAVRLEDRHGSRQATWLSHVSRRFRDIALGERSLWTTLSSEAWKDELDTLIPSQRHKCGVPYLHPTIVPYRFGSLSDSAFANTCFPMASNWRTLTLTESYNVNHSDPTHSVDEVFGILNRVYFNQPLRIQELHISGKSDRYSNVPAETCFGAMGGSGFTVIAMFHLRTKHPPHTFSSVTTFAHRESLYTSGNHEKLQEMLKFVVTLPSVIDLEVELVSIAIVSIRRDLIRPFPDSQVPSRFVVYSQTSQLRHQLLSRLPSGPEAFIAEFMRALHLPRLERFSAIVECGVSGAWGGNQNLTESYSGLSRALIPAHVAHPDSRLSSLSFKFIRDTHPSYARMPPRSFSLSIPLDKIPTVSTLILFNIRWRRIFHS